MTTPKTSSIISAEFLDELQSNKSLPKDTWYFIAAATLCILNRPDDVASVFKRAVDDSTDRDEQLRIARRIREALIKSSAVGGLPKVSSISQRSRFSIENILPNLY